MQKLVFILFVVFTTGCFSKARHDRELEDALKSLAPKNGQGKKDYLYENGSVKRSDFWQNYDVVRSDFFTQNGELFFSSARGSNRFMEPEMDSSGKITGFIQGERFGLSKDGWAVVLGKHGVVKTQLWNQGQLEKEVVFEHDEDSGGKLGIRD